MTIRIQKMRLPNGKSFYWSLDRVTRAKICKLCKQKNLDEYRKTVGSYKDGSKNIHIPLCKNCRDAVLDWEYETRVKKK